MSLILNFLHFLGRKHYEHRIDIELAWELAKIHTDTDMQWDGMVLTKQEFE